MSLLRALFASVVICSGLTAADLTLRDGRTLRDYRILSQSPGTVTVRHAGGLAKIDKAQLPPELTAQYPADPAAIAAEQEANEHARTEYARQVASADRQRQAQIAAAAQARAARLAEVARHNAEIEALSRPLTPEQRRAAELAAYRTPSGCRTYVEQQAKAYFAAMATPSRQPATARPASVTVGAARTDTPGVWIFYGRVWVTFSHTVMENYGRNVKSMSTSTWATNFRCTATLPEAADAAPQLKWEWRYIEIPLDN